MVSDDKRFIVGIDLGTTNSAVSYVDLQAQGAGARRITLFNVPQLAGPGEFAALPVLPSFLYIPGEYDVGREDLSIPWRWDGAHFVGAFARDHGAKVPARLVSSAKSWLCHAGADRRARILPWGAGAEVRKVSPVEATAAYLSHIRLAWNYTRGDDDDAFLENQVVILTVPASFDQVARDLTLEAARQAGLADVTLIEEPLAAFYSWLIRHETRWERYVRPNELILVCDVGGGTTDFTLITLREVGGSPRFERIAVGDHLILGGDNVDLALARHLESRLGAGRGTLNTDRWKNLCHQCRQAKEALLGGAAESRKITLMGAGSKLIGGTLAAELHRGEVEKIVLEGFYPLEDPQRLGSRAKRQGISEFGLPYESEPAVTRHLGWFLEHHRDTVRQTLQRDSHVPDLILFNGGSLKPALVQERIRRAIGRWFQDGDDRLPRVLENPSPDLAVALGAAYYGLVKLGQGVRVGSGSPRAYYLGVGDGAETAAGGRRQAICLVERGLEEGSQIELQDKQFEVRPNQPVSFDLFSSSYRSGDRCGDLVAVDDSLTALPPIQTVIQYGKKGDQQPIPVQMEAGYTEMGTLAVWCRSLISPHRWQLQFQLRDAAAPAAVPDAAMVEEGVLTAARELIRAAFRKGAEKRRLDGLVRGLADIAGGPKEKWPLGLIRALADDLLALAEVRGWGPDFESRWLNLVGFCLRPGFGDGFDEHRLQNLWKVYLQGPAFPKNGQVRSEWWILWRRVAGGLKPGQQRQVLQDLTPLIFPKKGGGPKLPPQERVEIWMAVANMERLSVKDKTKWGRQLLTEIQPGKAKPQILWALSRLGAREMLYGPVDRVIPPAEVADWILRLMAGDWKKPQPVGTALGQLARRTGDRVRDVAPAVAARVLEWMARHEGMGACARLVKEVVPVARQEESALFGESLPSGIVLHA